jgi:hypothetical protein
MRTTLNLDDELVTAAKVVAVKRRTTLTAVIEEALRAALEAEEEEPLDLPVDDDAPPFPPDFPWHGSAAKMIEFFEGPDAPP